MDSKIVAYLEFTKELAVELGSSCFRIFVLKLKLIGKEKMLALSAIVGNAVQNELMSKEADPRIIVDLTDDQVEEYGLEKTVYDELKEVLFFYLNLKLIVIDCQK